MGLVYRLKKGSSLSYVEMDANLATLSTGAPDAWYRMGD